MYLNVWQQYARRPPAYYLTLYAFILLLLSKKIEYTSRNIGKSTLQEDISPSASHNPSPNIRKTIFPHIPSQSDPLHMCVHCTVAHTKSTKSCRRNDLTDGATHHIHTHSMFCYYAILNFTHTRSHVRRVFGTSGGSCACVSHITTRHTSNHNQFPYTDQVRKAHTYSRLCTSVWRTRDGNRHIHKCQSSLYSHHLWSLEHHNTDRA